MLFSFVSVWAEFKMWHFIFALLIGKQTCSGACRRPPLNRDGPPSCTEANKPLTFKNESAAITTAAHVCSEEGGCRRNMEQLNV